MAGTTERVDLIEPGHTPPTRIKLSTSTPLNCSVILLSRTPEDAYHNALLLSKTTAAIHIFYVRPIWNIDLLATLLRGSFPRICRAISRRHSRLLPQIPRHGPPPSSARRLSLPSRRFSPLMLVPTDQPFPSCCRFLHLPH